MNEFLRKLLALPEQGSILARQIDELHFIVIGVTMLGATIVGVTALYFVVRYRRREGDTLTPHVKAPVVVEAFWIGVLLALFIGIWVAGYRLFIRIRVPPANAMEVYVTGKQWMWKFAYPDGRSSISVLTVPANRPVRLIMTSRDVIHSLSIPAFRVKQDVLPGRYTTLWFEAEHPGTYQILCAEYCGAAHSTMWASVVVLSPADYEAWLDGAEPRALDRALDLTASERPVGRRFGDPPLLRGLGAGQTRQMEVIGREVAVRHACLACHTVDGRRHIGPSFHGLFKAERRLQDGSTVIADAPYLTESMVDPAAKVVAGFPAVMPSFQGLLSAAEVAALVEFIRSLEGSQPSDSPLLAPPPDAAPLPPLGTPGG